MLRARGAVKLVVERQEIVEHVHGNVREEVVIGIVGGGAPPRRGRARLELQPSGAARARRRRPRGTKGRAAHRGG